MPNNNKITKSIYLTLYYSCSNVNEDPFRACFGCDFRASAKSSYDHYGYFYSNGYQDYNRYIERQTGETFQSTAQSRRVVCRGAVRANRNCKLRVDRAMQLRQTTYGRSTQFVQSEQYLSDDDII